MLFQKIFIEEQVKDHARTRQILAKIGADKELHYIRKVEDVFGRVYRPYLQKREDLNLFIGRKEGQLIKATPEAYGTGSGLHYYFIHQYNCIYECEYCYLQGYFHSPDIVLFVNHEEIATEIEKLCRETHQDEKEVWFHAGEFSDSLALSNLTEEWPLYWDLFSDLPNGRLELRTKSANTRGLAQLPPRDNIFLSWSLSPEQAAQQYEHKVPPVKARIQAMAKVASAGHKLGVHLDPIVMSDNVTESYRQLVHQLLTEVPESSLSYLSLGTVRFSKDVFQTLQKNYPGSSLLGQEFVSGYDAKVRYFRPLRRKLMGDIREICVAAGISPGKIYFCMEETASCHQGMP